MAETKQCVFCLRKNTKQNRTEAEGRHLRFILDEVDNTYHCNECDDQIRHLIQNYDYYQFYGRQNMSRNMAWVEETSRFEEGLDFEWTENSLLRELEELEKEEIFE